MNAALGNHPAAALRPHPGRHFADRATDLAPLADFASVLLAAAGCTLAHALTLGDPSGAFGGSLAPAALVVAALAAFILYDDAFGTLACRGEAGALLRSFALRWLRLSAVLVALALASPASAFLPPAWLGLWAASSLLLTGSSRFWLARRLLRTVRSGVLSAAELARLRAGPLLEYLDGLPLLLLADRPIKRWGAVLKATEDRLGGALITLALLPVLGLIVLLIRLDSPGPVLFRQRRHGYNNREFDIYKFRTMRPAAAGALQQTLRNDRRVTRVGRWLRALSLDELPQLFNVLEGDMSLVGPRPHAVDMRTEDRLCQEIIDAYPHRHRVKPGITGWAQVHGLRGATQTAEQVRRRVELDLHYVRHWSLALDFRILLMTVREVLKRTNAY